MTYSIIFKEPFNECKHPPERLFSWFAWDGTLCIGCCDCGEILKGSTENEEAENNE